MVEYVTWNKIIGQKISKCRETRHRSLDGASEVRLEHEATKQDGGNHPTPLWSRLSPGDHVPWSDQAGSLARMRSTDSFQLLDAGGFSLQITVHDDGVNLGFHNHAGHIVI